MITRLKNGEWSAKIDRVLPSGERIRASFKANSEKAARAWHDPQIAAIEEAVLRHKLGVDRPIIAACPTLQAFHDSDWWPNLEAKVAAGDFSSATLASYRSHMKRVLRAFGTLPLDKVDGAAIDRFRAANPDVKVRPLLVPLSSLLKLAVTRGKAPANVVATEELLKTPVVVKEPRHLSLDNVLRVTASLADSPREQLAVALAGLAGLRMGEVRGLRWSDIHASKEGAYIGVENNLVKGLDNARIEKGCKANRGRKVPICKSLEALLVAAAATNHKGYVCAGPDGEPIEGGGSETRLQRLLRQRQKALGLELRTFHELRKSAIRWWEERRVEPWNISYWAGHGGQHMARVTRDHYSGEPTIDWTDAAKMREV
jgi:integrase